MIKRIVRMTFQPEALPGFLVYFGEIKDKIKAMDGCLHLELWQELGSPHVLYTFSLWETEQALDAYRQTELFSKVWKKTKEGFAEKAVAWSVAVVG